MPTRSQGGWSYLRQWWIALVALVAVGLIPVYAFRSLNAAGNYAVLGLTVSVSGTVTDVNAVNPGGGPGVVGSDNPIVEVAPAVLNAAGGTSTGPAVTPDRQAVLGTANAFFDEAQAVGTDPTGGTGDLSALVTLGPGIYFLNETATLTAGDLTLTGAGDYLIVINGDFNTAAGNDILLAGGASAANVIISPLNSSINGSTITGVLLHRGNTVVTDSTVNGKVLAYGSVQLAGTVTINDAGVAPVVSTTGSETYNVCVGDPIAYTVSATDPDPTGDTTLTISGTPAGATHTPAAPPVGPNPSTDFSWIPAAAGSFNVVYTATDETGAQDVLTVTINVSAPPVLTADTFTGARGGTGTLVDPLVLCPGDTLNYNVASTDPDGDNVTVSVATTPGGLANLSHTPPLAAAPAPSVNTVAEFSPDLSQQGLAAEITYTSTDNSAAACATQASVFVEVRSLPAFTAPTTTIQNVCVGDLLQFDVTAADADAGEVLQLSVEDLPTGAIQAPNFLGTDTAGPGGGDLLAFGNPITSRFEWTPLVADVGTYLVTYTAVDDLGCEAELVVVVNVSQRPTLAVEDGEGDPVAEGQVLTVCAGDELNYTVTADDPDGAELVTLSATDVPANLSHTPVLPAASAAPGAPVASQASFFPTLAQGGQTFVVTYTATDDSTGLCSVSRTVTIYVSTPPVFNLPTGPINACVGDELRIPVRASDADSGDVVALTVDPGTVPAGATLEPVLPASGNPVQTELVWTPAAPGTTVVEFTATDASGCETEQALTINVSALPTVAATGFTGQQGGAGTPGDPLRLCVGQAVTYTVNAAAVGVGENVTLTQDSAPAGLLPQTNPLSSGTPTAAVGQTFTPTSGQGGQTFTVTYTATDSSGGACEATTTVTFQVSNPPVFDLPAATTLNVCAGDPVTYQVRASDADAGDVVTLSLGTPLTPGATLTPALPTNGNPASTTFTWTPAAAGSFPVQYTATDASGCAVSTTVTVNVSARPTVAATGFAGQQGGAGTPADPLRLCVGQALTYTVNANAGGDLGETVTLTQDGAPAGLLPQTNPLASGAATAAVGQTFTPAAGQGGQTFTVTYTATDSSGGACEAATTVTIQVSNPPVFDLPTATTRNVCAGTPVTYEVRASDADTGDVVTLTSTALPAGASLTPALPVNGNPASTTFAWTPAAAGSFPVTYTATDASGCAVSTTVTVNVSAVPVLTLPAALGAEGGSGTAADPYLVCPPGTSPASTLTYLVTADDTDATETVTLEVTGAPAGTHTPALPQSSANPGDAVSSQFSFTPTVAQSGQTFTLTYTARDNSAAACSVTGTVVIRVSYLPQITADPTSLDLCVGQSAQIRVRATDQDGGLVTLSQAGAPASLTFAPGLPLGGNPVETVATFTPTAADAGTQVVTFTATDADGCSQATTVTLNVSQVPTVAVLGAAGAMHGSGTAADPYVVCPPGTEPASTLTYTVSASDPDAGDSIELSQSGSPAAALYTPGLPQTGTPGAGLTSAFSYTPTAGDAGQTFTVTYTVRDDSAADCTATETVVIHVTRLPQVTSTPSSLSLCVGQTGTFRVRGTDADGGLVTLSQAGAPASLTFAPGLPLGGNPVETVATFTPTAADAGTRTVTFTATDTDGCSQTTTVTLNVSQVPTVAVTGVSGAPGSGTAADPYVVCPPGTAAASTLTYTVNAADADATQTVTLSQTGGPAGATHTPALPVSAANPGDAVSTAFSYTPAAGDAGQTFTVTYTAADDFTPACSASATVVIRVANLPQFVGPTPADGAVFNVCTGERVTFRVRATDADPGEPVTLSQSGGLAAFFTPGLPAVGNPVETVFDWTPGAGAPASTALVFTATDSSGCAVTRTITVNVSALPTVTVSGVSGGPGTGTAADPYVVCPPGTGPASTLTYTVTGADADADQAVTLTQSGAPAGATHTPILPQTGADGADVSTVFSYTPVAGDAGQTFTVTYTATDDSDAECTGTATVVIRVANLPQFTAPTQTVYNVCAGDPVQFTVRATDQDPGDVVTLTSTALPAGATLTPTVASTGNPVESQFQWIPTALGTSTVTFTITDRSGCAQSRTVTINVSAVPTLGLGNVTGSQGGTGTEADPLVVCATPAAPLTFTVTGSDADPAHVVTLTQTGAPSGATFTVAGTNPAVGTFSFSPTAQQGGDVYAVTFTGTDNSPSGCDRTLTVYLRVSSLPVITATPNSLTLCEGQAVRYRVRASDADPTAVTLSGPTVVSSPGAPALALTHTPSLPASGNSVETEAVGVTPVVTADATYTLTYTATDSDGCVTTTTVTVTVLNTPPSSVELTRVGDGDPFGEEICYTAVVFDNCPADEGGPRRVPGVPVLFTVTGTTGNSGVFTVVTNANGEAVHCLTPRFPGTITVTAGIDLNGDGVVDAGTTPDTDNVTVPAPVQVGPGCFISGRGKVNVSDPLFGNLPVLGSFTVDVSPKRNGTFKGSISLTVPNAGTTGGRRTNIVIRSTRLESMSCSEDATGRRAVLFGRATVKGMSTQGLSGTVPFRVDVLDAGTPGVPNDQFVLTLLNTATDSPVGPLGGNLAAERGRRNPKDDIKVRLGASIP